MNQNGITEENEYYLIIIIIIILIQILQEKWFVCFVCTHSQQIEAEAFAIHVTNEHGL